MLHMLLIGYAYGIRSERQLCSEVHLNLAYRWFCRLGFDGSSYQWGGAATTQNRSTVAGASYDASGNMLSDGLHTYTYDGENRVSAVTDQNVSYQYDAEGKRVATLNGSAVTQEYLYDTAGDLVTTVDPTGVLVRMVILMEHYFSQLSLVTVQMN